MALSQKCNLPFLCQRNGNFPTFKEPFILHFHTSIWTHGQRTEPRCRCGNGVLVSFSKRGMGCARGFEWLTLTNAGTNVYFQSYRMEPIYGMTLIVSKFVCAARQFFIQWTITIYFKRKRYSLLVSHEPWIMSLNFFWKFALCGDIRWTLICLHLIDT